MKLTTDHAVGHIREMIMKSFLSFGKSTAPLLAICLLSLGGCASTSANNQPSIEHRLNDNKEELSGVAIAAAVNPLAGILTWAIWEMSSDRKAEQSQQQTDTQTTNTPAVE